MNTGGTKEKERGEGTKAPEIMALNAPISTVPIQARIFNQRVVSFECDPVILILK